MLAVAAPNKAPLQLVGDGSNRLAVVVVGVKQKRRTEAPNEVISFPASAPICRNR